MDSHERDFWIALGLWGAASVTVFGTGLFALVEGFYKSGIPLTVLGISAIVYTAMHLKEKRLRFQHALMGALVLTWLFLGYAIYTRNPMPRPSLPEAMLSWGGDDESCNLTVDGGQLADWQSKYNLYEICLFRDPSIDPWEDERLAISHPFNIVPGIIAISVPFSRPMVDYLQTRILNVTKGMPPNQNTEVSGILWLLIVALPKDTDYHAVHRLSDVRRIGGTILSNAGTGFTLTPPSIVQHSGH